MYRFLEYTAGQYMTRQVRTVTRQTTLRELGALFVAPDKDLVGIIAREDIMRALKEATQAPC